MLELARRGRTPSSLLGWDEEDSPQASGAADWKTAAFLAIRRQQPPFGYWVEREVPLKLVFGPGRHLALKRINP